MGALYSHIKLLHITCVALSGSLFSLRGLMMMRGSSLSHHPLLRYFSYVIDSTLLGAAVILATVLQQYPFVDAWLTMKMALLVVYIALGVLALRGCRTLRARTVYFIAALLTYGFIVSVAITHHPLGVLRNILG